jgi:hypothetical protein
MMGRTRPSITAALALGLSSADGAAHASGLGLGPDQRPGGPLAAVAPVSRPRVLDSTPPDGTGLYTRPVLLASA